MSGTGGERDPRAMADRIPDDALIIGLVYAAQEGDDGAVAADSLAMELGHRREHTLLTSATGRPSPLDLLLGGADGAGLPAALQGRAGLTDIAVQPVDRPFVYLPAGRRPEQMSRLLTGDLFTSFVERIRERGGTLLLFLPEPELAEAAARGLLDGYVALGDATADVRSDLPTYGRLEVSGHGDADAAAVGAGVGHEVPVGAVEESLEPTDAWPGPTNESTGASPGPADEPAGGFEFAPVLGAGEDMDPDAAAASAATDGEVAVPSVVPAGPGIVGPETADWHRHRARAEFPTLRVAMGAGAVAVLVIGWWIFGSTARGPVDEETEPTMSAPAPSDGEMATAPEPQPPALTPAEAEAAVAQAPELPYSVLVASYAARSDAEDRLLRLRRGPGGPYFVVPTLIRGALYHRVFAGARPDAESARALMTELVESGRKDDASSWHIRPARLAYLLGAYGTRAEASARQQAVAAAEVPAYTLSAALGEGPDSVFQVYAGAYESPVAARALIPLLESAEEEAELVNRRGRRP